MGCRPTCAVLVALCLASQAAGCAVPAELEEVDAAATCPSYLVRSPLLYLRRSPGTDQKPLDDVLCELGPTDRIRRVAAADGSLTTSAAASTAYPQGEWWLVDVNPDDASATCHGRGWIAGVLPGALTATCVDLPTCGAGEHAVAVVRGDQIAFRSAAAIDDRNLLGRLPQSSRLLVHGVVAGTSAEPWLEVELLEPVPASADPSREDFPATITPRASPSRTGYVAANLTQLGCSPRAGLVRPSWATNLWAEQTYRSTSPAVRAANIALAASRLDGVEIAAGARLSYLDTIIQPYKGQFSAFGAYLGALPCPLDLLADRGTCRMFGEGASTSGNAVEGGGVCGMSTALHRTVMASGLGVKNWYAHSERFATFDSVYGYQGEDAQVAWNSNYLTNQDYGFVNDSGGRLFLVTGVRTSLDGDTLATVQIWGELPRDRKVRILRPCLGGCADSLVPSADGSEVFLADHRELVERVTWRVDGGSPGAEPVVDTARYPNSIWSRDLKMIEGAKAELLRFSPYYAE